MNEAQFQAAVIALAKLTGWTWYHTHNSKRSPSGYPDLTLVRDRVMFRELKTEKGRLTPAQVEWIERLRAAGADVGVWRPRDLKEHIPAQLARAGAR